MKEQLEQFANNNQEAKLDEALQEMVIKAKESLKNTLLKSELFVNIFFSFSTFSFN